MQKVIPIPLMALLCLFFACKKQEKLRPAKQLATTSTSNCDIQSGYGFYKTYTPDGHIDSLDSYAYSISPWRFKGKVKYDSNHVYLISCGTDTLFTAELNSQHQIISSKYEPHDYNYGTAYFNYNLAGQLTRVVRDTGRSDDVYIHYDSLGNVTSMLTPDSTSGVWYTYDYSTPIGLSDYYIEPWGTVWADILLARELNLININPHHKVVRAVGNLYPEFDRYYQDQVMDAQGNVISMNGLSFTLHCF